MKISDIRAGQCLPIYGNMSDDGMGSRSGRRRGVMVIPGSGSVSEHHIHFTVNGDHISSGIFMNFSLSSRWLFGGDYGIL